MHGWVQMKPMAGVHVPMRQSRVSFNTRMTRGVFVVTMRPSCTHTGPADPLTVAGAQEQEAPVGTAKEVDGLEA